MDRDTLKRLKTARLLTEIPLSDLGGTGVIGGKLTVSYNNTRNPSLSRGLLETSKTLFLPSGSIMASATPFVSGQGRCSHAREDRGVGCSSLYVYRTISIFVTRIQQMIPSPCCIFYDRPA